MSKSITIDENILVQLTQLNKQLELANTKNNIHIPCKRREGSYELLKNGKARLYYMLDKVPYRTTVEATNDEEATKELALFVESVKKGNFINTNYSFVEFAQIWLDRKVRPNSDKYKCVPKYISYLNNRILPYIGNIKLKKISKKTLISYFDTIKETNTLYQNRKTNTKLKPETVLKIKSIIHACLEYAVECEVLYRNPCDNIKIDFSSNVDLNSIQDLVKKKRKKVHYFDMQEYKAVCSLLENEIIQFYQDKSLLPEKRLKQIGRRIFVLLDLKTGMRRSELFGLARNEEFNDIDIKNKTFDVNKTRHYAKEIGRYTKYPKNDSSIRKKALPKNIIPYLELYFKLLDELNYKEMYIFEHLSIDGMSSWWDKWLKQNDFTDIRLHDIRHCHATILLFLGTDLKTISERLGHSDIQMTFNVYTDVLKELDIKSAEKIDNL